MATFQLDLEVNPGDFCCFIEIRGSQSSWRSTPPPEAKPLSDTPISVDRNCIVYCIRFYKGDCWCCFFPPENNPMVILQSNNGRRILFSNDCRISQDFSRP